MTSWPNYVNDAKVWLPMTAATHDPANNRTLDVSGNNNHFQLGDGVTANTFPTKLFARGYSFDGSNDYLQCINNFTTAITEGTWVVLYAARNPTSVVEYIYDHRDVVNCRALLRHTPTTPAIYCGDLVNAASVTANPIYDQASFIAGYRTTDGYRRLYWNGINATPNNTGVSLPSTVVAGNPRIGISYAGTVPFSGQVFFVGVWEYALSELQLRDLEARLRRQLNDI